jgi:low temperature requirement protein LtrA
MYKYIEERKDQMFNGGAETIIKRLSNVSKETGNALTVDLEYLAERVGSFSIIC